jgi:hypothetical protein
MKKKIILAAALFWTAGLALAQIQAGISVGAGGDSFHLAIGSYYHAPPDQITVCQQQHIPDEDQPVVFFVANQVHVAPGVIINLRAGGMSWVDIFHRYHLSPRVLYVPIHGRAVGPYAGFYAYYNGHGRGRVRLVDADIVNMVNLKFATEYYHRTPEEVMNMRAGGRSYVDIHNQYRHPGPGQGDHHFDHHDDHGDGNWH